MKKTQNFIAMTCLRLSTRLRSVQSTFELKPRLAGTEFLDAETGRQKSPLNLANGCRDINPRSRWPEIPAETPYFESYRKRAVCGDWMVGATGIEPVTPSMSTRCSPAELRALERSD